MPTYATRSETRVELWIGAYSLVAIVLIVEYAHVSGRAAYLDVALTYGLLSFVSVLAVARYIERGL